MTDSVRDDSWKAAQFDAAIVPKQARSIQEAWETQLLETFPKNQRSGESNPINGAAHRFIASGANDTISLEDFIYAKFALDKANVTESRIAIVDPIHEMTLNNLSNLVNVYSNPQFEGIVNTGFGKNMRFLRNIYGFDVYISNRLPRIATETIQANDVTVEPPVGTGSKTISNATAIQFFGVGDETELALMSAWRRMPFFEYNRNVRRRRDEFYMSARYGFGVQRPQAGVTLLASGTAYK